MESPPIADDPLTGRPAGGTELSWCRAVPGGTGITVLALLLSRSISLPLLRSSIIRLQLCHPILRALLPSASSASSNPPLLISPTPSAEIDIIPSDILPPLAVDSRAPPISLFHAVLENEINRNPWAEGKSVGSFFASIYELRESGGSVLALRLHTGTCDRIAGIAILKELMNLMDGGVDRVGVGGAEEEKEGEEKEGEVGLAIEDLIRKDDAWKPFWIRGKDLIGYSLNGLRSSCLRFEDAVSARKSEFVRLVMDAAMTRRLLTACEVKGIKLCAALTAAGFLATHASNNLQKNQPETYSVITLVDCRQYLDPPLNEKHIGFYHSGILNTHTVNGGEGFWDVAIRCHKACSNAKKNKKHLSDIGELNYLMCKAIENPHLTPASSLRTALMSVFEEPVDYCPVEQLEELGVEDFLGCASVHGVGASIALFDTIRNGQLDSVCVYPAPLHSREQMEELVGNMKRILVESCVVDEGEEIE